jgi:hypothetical protein
MVDKSLNRFPHTRYENPEFGPLDEGNLVEAAAK